MRRTRSAPSLAAALLSLSLAACGDPEPRDPAPGDTADMGADAGTTAPPPMLSTPGRYVITSIEAPPECAQAQVTPKLGDLVSVSAQGQGRLLRYGSVALLELSPGSFAGCETGPVNDQGVTSSYASTQLTWQPQPDDAALMRATLSLDQINNGTLASCQSLSFTARKLGECELAGTFSLRESALVSGECGLSWDDPEATVTSEGGDEVFSLDWDGFDDEVILDATGCGFSVSKGGAGQLWYFNSATRRASLTWRLEGDEVSATLEDALDGMTFDGLTCPSGTFEATLDRVTGIDEEVAPQPTTCAAERPPVCGDGVCDPRESCSSCQADCGCAEGASCAYVVPTRTYACLTTCDDITVAGQCGAGARCGVIDDAGFAVRDSTPTYCVPSLDKPLETPCEGLSDCADGLICHRSMDVIDGRLGVCRQPCDEGLCDDGYTCQPTGDGSNRGFLPEAISACAPSCEVFSATDCPQEGLVCSSRGPIGFGDGSCVARATSTGGVGEPCGDEARCAVGLSCITTTSGATGEQVSACRLPCDTDADCSVVGGGATCLSVRGQFGACV